MDIENLTAETILEDWVFEEALSEEDEVIKAKLVLALVERADKLEVKTKFNTLMRAFKKQREKQQRSVPKTLPQNSSMTEFVGDYPRMFCGSWIANENGVDGYSQLGLPIQACYTPVLPVQRLINVDTDNEKIKLAFKKNNRWKEIIIDKDIIASATRIVQISRYGVGVTSENARNLVRYLADMENYNMNLIPEQLSTSKLGWVKGEFMPYSKELVFDNEIKFKDAYESIKEHGNKSAWMELARDIRKGNRFEPKISLIGSLASILIEPLNALPFILNIYGETGKGKSVSMMFATSCWANPGENAFITDPKSTVTALELRLDLLNSLPMMIDDMSQIKKKCGGDFTDLIYMLCSGKGKDRSNQTLGLNKSTTWKNIILTNYEHSLVTETMQGGAVNRIIDIPCGDGYIFENGNAVVEIIKQNYGFAGEMFLDEVKQIGFDQIRQWQKRAYMAIVKKAKDQGCEKEEKQILPMSILLTADRIATERIFQDGAYLDFETCVDLLKNKGEVDENQRGYDFIMNEVLVNKVKFVPDPSTGQYRGEIWGSIDNGYVNINKNIFEQMVKRGEGFASKTFLAWANKHELLSHYQNRNAVRRSIGGASDWFICLKLRDGIDNAGNIKEMLPTDEGGFVSTANLTSEEQEEMPFN